MLVSAFLEKNSTQPLDKKKESNIHILYQFLHTQKAKRPQIETTITNIKEVSYFAYYVKSSYILQK